MKFNLPSLGAGDNVQLQGVYTQNAVWYSGIPDGMWGENGAVNGNGLAMTVGDTYYAGVNAAGNAVWSTPTAWSVGATFEHHFSPQFSIDPEIAYADVALEQLAWASFRPTRTSWIVGGVVGHWDPVPHLDFEFELLYQSTHQSTPGNLVRWQRTGTIDGNRYSARRSRTTADGFAGRFEVTRSF